LPNGSYHIATLKGRAREKLVPKYPVAIAGFVIVGGESWSHGLPFNEGGDDDVVIDEDYSGGGPEGPKNGRAEIAAAEDAIEEFAHLGDGVQTW